MMRAVLLGECGAAPALGEREVPAAGPGEVVVRVTAASITPLDLLCASGTSYFGTPATPYVPGVQGVGELADGSSVWFATSAGMRPGDGSMAEYAVVESSGTVALPDGVDHRLVAALGLSAVAAYQVLHTRGDLQAGEQVLVLGGGGVVGQAAIQLAKLGGARRVIAACRSEAARERARKVGADDVVLLDGPSGSGPGAVGQRVAELAAHFKAAAEGPVDLVVDPVFGIPAAAALRTLRPGGVLVNLGSSAGEQAPIDSSTLRSGSLRLLGYTNNELTAEQRTETVRLLAGLVGEGRLTVDYEPVAFADVTDAWSRQSGGRADRRIVLTP